MARYDYKCSNCGIFEIQQSMKEEALQKCPKCEGNSIGRIISGNVGIKFKGTGFYVNDYAKTDSSFDKYKPREPDEKKFF